MNLDAQTLEIDWERLSQISDDDEEFQLELLNMLAADITEQLVELKNAIDQPDSSQLQQLAHYLKGAIANVGVNSMTSIARQLEDAGRNQQFDVAQVLLANFIQQQDLLLAYLAKKAG
jgi:HPt (histidine-containing phosphotransfer) domain-containing protein